MRGRKNEHQGIYKKSAPRLFEAHFHGSLFVLK